MLTRVFVNPFRKTLRCLRSIYSSEEYESTKETKTVMNILLIGYEKDSELKTFAIEDLVIEMVCIDVAQDTTFDKFAISLKHEYSESCSLS